MQMWPKILTLMESAQDPVICHACWISGTAIQNNISAQKSVSRLDLLQKLFDLDADFSSEQFYSHNPLPTIFSLVSSVHPTTSSVKISPQTRAKAVYCLSAALKHWPGAIDSLSNDSNRGWAILREGLRDPEVTIRRKIAFLLDMLIRQGGEGPTGEEGMQRTVQAIQENGIVDGLVSSLTNPLPVGANGDDEPDWDLQEKSFAALMSAEKAGALNSENKAALKQVVENWGKMSGGWENVGMSDSEAQEAIVTLSS